MLVGLSPKFRIWVNCPAGMLLKAVGTVVDVVVGVVTVGVIIGVVGLVLVVLITVV